MSEITVLISSSVIPSHPSSSIFEDTYASIRHHLPSSRAILMQDGVRPAEENRREAYEQYLKAVRVNFKDVEVRCFSEFNHQAQMTIQTLKDVDTPLILFVEHDTPLVPKSIDWEMLCESILASTTNHIRLHYDEAIHPEHQHMMLGKLNPNLIKTNQWHQRPHLASADFYRAKLKAHFSPNNRTFIEDCIYGPCCYGNWDDWKLTVYDPEGTGQNMRRSGHTNGRDGEKKYDDQLVF